MGKESSLEQSPHTQLDQQIDQLRKLLHRHLFISEQIIENGQIDTDANILYESVAGINQQWQMILWSVIPRKQVPLIHEEWTRKDFHTKLAIKTMYDNLKPSAELLRRVMGIERDIRTRSIKDYLEE